MARPGLAFGAGAAMTAVISRPHVTDVPPGAAPAAVASGTVPAVVVARAADAVGVLRPADADVVAASAGAAVAPRAFRIAGVLLAVADELVLAGGKMGGERERHTVEHFHQVAAWAHVHFDPGG